MMGRLVKVDRVEVNGDLMSGEVDVWFGLDRQGRRQVVFGGDSRADETNTVWINGVGYVATHLVSVDIGKGWMPDYSASRYSLTRLDYNGDPTDSARHKMTEWVKVNTPRMAETHSDRWVDVWRASASVDIEARRRELEAQLRHLRQYEMMLDVLARAARHRVVPFAKSVSCSWKNGYMGQNGHAYHTGAAFGWVEVEIAGPWVRVAVAVAESSYATRFTPAPIELVSFRHEPEPAKAA